MRRMRRMRRKTIMIVVIFALMMTVTCASNPPQAIITCKDCKEISEGYLLVYANCGSTMTLSGISSQDDIGIVSYIWTKDGLIVNKDAQYSFIVTEDTKYVLTVMDGENKSDSETVEIRLKYVAPPNRCLPDWKGKIVLSNGADLEIGDEISLDANLQSSDCVDYEIEWSVDDSSIIIFDKNSKITKIRIGNGTIIGTHTIKAVLSNSEKSREQETQINVVRNTPPTLINNYEYPYSYGYLYVDFSESKTGSTGNENNDYIRSCYVRLEDEHGSFVSDGSWDSSRNKMPLIVKLKTYKMGTHYLIATITDSHGLISTVKKEIWVKEGDSKYDPLIVWAPDRNNCTAGEECIFNVYKTFQHYKNKGISVNFAYYDVTYKNYPEQLAGPKGYYLTGPRFRHIFPHSGNFVIRVMATSGDRSGFKDVDIIVTDNKTTSNLTPTPTLTSAPTITPTRTPYPYRTSTPPETPGMEFEITFVVLITTVFVFHRRKNNKTL